MTQTQVFQRKLEFTSSLNKYFLCDKCGLEKRFNDKKSLQNHIKCCDKNANGILIPIKTRVTQTSKNLRSTDIKTQPTCQVCKKIYVNFAKLRYHIRHAHFNLISKTPYYQQKKVNQIWFENVQNSDAVIEVHKTGINSLVLRRLSKNTAIKVADVNTGTEDLSTMYPTYKPVKCDDCKSQVYSHLLVEHRLKHHSDIEKSSPGLKT